MLASHFKLANSLRAKKMRILGVIRRHVKTFQGISKFNFLVFLTQTQFCILEDLWLPFAETEIWAGLSQEESEGEKTSNKFTLNDWSLKDIVFVYLYNLNVLIRFNVEKWLFSLLHAIICKEVGTWSPSFNRLCGGRLVHSVMQLCKLF